MSQSMYDNVSTDNAPVCSYIESAENINSSFEITQSYCVTEVTKEAMHNSEEISNGSSNKETTLEESSLSELTKYPNVPKHELNKFREQILSNINKKLTTEYYDFCLVACEDDYNQANKFKFYLMREFNLKGCMLEDDSFSLGRDELDAYEDMMNRSTKVLFYFTDKFNKSLFYRRLQNSAVYQSLMPKIVKEKEGEREEKREEERCVPVLPNGKCRVPLALSGITSIELKDKELSEIRIKATFNDKLREHRKEEERKIQEFKLQQFKKLLGQKIEDYRQGIASGNLEIPSTISEPSPEPVSWDSSAHSCHFSNNNTNDYTNGNSFNILSRILNVVGINSDLIRQLLKNVSEVCMRNNSLSVVNSRNIHIGDFNYIIGGNSSEIETRIHRFKNDDLDSVSQVSSDSDNSDSEDSIYSEASEEYVYSDTSEEHIACDT